MKIKILKILFPPLLVAVAFLLLPRGFVLAAYPAIDGNAANFDTTGQSIYTVTWEGEVFTPQQAETINSISLSCSAGSAGITMTAFLANVIGGAPSTTIVSSYGVNTSATTNTLYTFDLQSSYTASTSTPILIGIKTNNGSTAVTCGVSTAHPYANGTNWVYSSGAWYQQNINYDLFFVLNGTVTNPSSGGGSSGGSSGGGSFSFNNSTTSPLFVAGVPSTDINIYNPGDFIQIFFFAIVVFIIGFWLAYKI